MVKKMFLAIFVNRPIKPLGKKFQTKKTDLKKNSLSELQELEVGICVQPNFPIINMNLLNGLHKFARSMGPNTSVYGLCLTAFPKKGYKSLIIPFFCNQVYHKGPPHPLLSWLLIFFLNFVCLPHIRCSTLPE